MTNGSCSPCWLRRNVDCPPNPGHQHSDPIRLVPVADTPTVFGDDAGSAYKLMLASPTGTSPPAVESVLGDNLKRKALGELGQDSSASPQLKGSRNKNPVSSIQRTPQPTFTQTKLTSFGVRHGTPPALRLEDTGTRTPPPALELAGVAGAQSETTGETQRLGTDQSTQPPDRMEMGLDSCPPCQARLRRSQRISCGKP